MNTSAIEMFILRVIFENSLKIVGTLRRVQFEIIFRRLRKLPKYAH